MNTQLFIAKKCKVGFNMRADTYTGKLGYVIGHDGQKWRKEPSWESWREKFMEPVAFEIEKKKQWEGRQNQMKRYSYSPEQIKQNGWDLYETFKPHTHGWSGDITINPLEFDNVPTEGFVLNKKAGGREGSYSSWNPRATYCRVWDPRGFEFEISIPNLLFILQETTSVKGKGLDGEFVYSWDGKDLVLLPVGCDEYTKSAGFTKLQSGKVGVKDLVPGCSYKTKKQEDFIYLGRLNWYEKKQIKTLKEESRGRSRNYNYKQIVSLEKVHVFINKKHELQIFSRLANFASRNTDTPVDNYAELMDVYSKSKYSEKPVTLESKKKAIDFGNTSEENDWNQQKRGNLGEPFFIKEGVGFRQVLVQPKWEYNRSKLLNFLGKPNKNGIYFGGYTIQRNQSVMFEKDILSFISNPYECPTKCYTKQEIEAMDLQDIEIVRENGSKILLTQY